MVNIIKSLYEDTSSKGIHNAGLSVLLTVITGVRQGCILGDKLGDENNNEGAKRLSIDPPTWGLDLTDVSLLLQTTEHIMTQT